MPGPKLEKAESGTMVETRVETEAPVEEPPRAPTATELSCWLRTASAAAAVALASAGELLGVAETALPATTKAPPAAAEDCVPLTEPPEVEMKISFRVSGLCQKAGATSITT